VAAVAAVDPDTAAEALELIVVEYEELPAIFDVDSSMQPGAPISHDCGTVIKPRSVEGQLAGSVQMGLGYTLCEELVMDGGKIVNTNFLDYKMPGALDMPPSDAVHVDTYEPEGPMGAKECGEGLASPTAPAISEAVYH
jgi:CO/xanthine dehydrogenase Mo-binding subunit